jgi:hypothetical protein
MPRYKEDADFIHGKWRLWVEFNIDVEVEHDPAYGADADGRRGIPVTFIHRESQWPPLCIVRHPENGRPERAIGLDELPEDVQGALHSFTRQVAGYFDPPDMDFDDDHDRAYDTWREEAR